MMDISSQWLSYIQRGHCCDGDSVQAVNQGSFSKHFIERPHNITRQNHQHRLQLEDINKLTTQIKHKVTEHEIKLATRDVNTK